MAKDKKLKVSKNKVVEDQVVTQSQSTSSTTEKKTKASKKQDTPPPDDENSQSTVTDEEEREVDDEEDDEDEKEDGDEEDDEDKKADHLSWPKSDDFELFKRIQIACPKVDSLNYYLRVNKLDWELVKFQDYSADQCLNRWLHIQAPLRHYRTLSDLLEDAKGKHNHMHPEQPKKPLSSYRLYYIEQKEAVMDEQPNLGMGELSKIIARMYNGLSHLKKTKYLELARKQMEEYQEQMKKFMDAHPDYVLQKSKSAKAVPPKIPTPFNLFSDEKIVELLAEGMTWSDARERCRDAYKKLKDKKKLKLIHRALEKEDEYNEEFRTFQLMNPEVSAKQPSLLTKEELRMKNESMGKPMKPPSTGYLLFFKQRVTRGEPMTDIGIKWNELSDEERAFYDNKSKRMSNVYQKKYASFFETLTPEQRRAELIGSLGKNRKRTAAAQKDDQPIGKKAKSSAAVDAGSSYLESDRNGASGEIPREIPREIRPNTANKKQRKVNGKTVQNSKNEMPSTSKKSSASTSAKAVSVPRKAVKSTANALKSPERDSSSKKSAGNSDSKSLKLSPKSSRPASSVKSSKEPKTPVWAANQVLYNEAEPPKPPKDVAAYYVMTYHHSEAGPFYSTEIDLLWAKVSEKQKKKLMAEYDKLRNDYKQRFEHFVRNLHNDKLEAYREFMKKREQYDEDSEDGSDDCSTDEGDNSDNSSIWCEIDEDISIKL